MRVSVSGTNFPGVFSVQLPGDIDLQHLAKNQFIQMLVDFWGVPPSRNESATGSAVRLEISGQSSDRFRFMCMSINRTPPETDTNSDPLTGEHGAHPVATGVGAATLGAVGLAAAAAVAGPVGIAVALAGGSIIGGYVGKAAGEVIDPTGEAALPATSADESPTEKLEP